MRSLLSSAARFSTIGVAALLAVSAAALWPETAEAKFVFNHNHPDLDWYTIETEHFAVHYPKSRKTAEEGNPHYLDTEWTARRTAKIAEEMWPRMCAEFNYFLKEKVHIVLLNQSDELEGFTIPAWDWIEISANPGSSWFYRQRGRMDWLPDVLVHEFAHVVSLKAQATHSEGAQGVTIGGLYSDGVADGESGAEIVILENDPWYWTEGGAEYWSDEAGYNWWTPSRDMHIRTTVLEDRLLTYDEWMTVQQSHRWGDGERGYQQGYSFGLYLRQRFGSETYAKLGLESAKAWKPDWNVVLEEVTGIPARTLYDDWAAYVKQKYGDQYAKIKAEGEAVGRQLYGKPPDWEYTDPDGRDKFFDPRWKRKNGVTGKDLARLEREKAKEQSGGTYSLHPRFSDDGKWFGIGQSGRINLSKTNERTAAVFAGASATDAGAAFLDARTSASLPAGFMSTWDFVPGKDAVVAVGSEDSDFEPRSAVQAVTGVRFEGDGYNWNELWYFDIPQAEEKEGNLTYKGHKPVHVMGQEAGFAPKEWKKYARAIPNTKRASEPTVSPDGSKVAYFEFTDGTLNLVSINLDGTDKKRLTDFNDGTWMQGADWSPDGKQIAVTIFRNFQQDIWIMNADGSEARPLMYDRWEDADPYWAKDGSLYFSSDPTGIFNIYRYDPSSKKIHQLTNVIGGAETPSVTPEGNLVFTNYTAHGWKPYGIAKEDFLNKDVTSAFDLEWEAEPVKAAWEFREDLSSYEVRKYKGEITAPSAGPQINITNDSRDNVSVQAGGYIFVQDYVEKHGGYVNALLGEDMLFLGQYFYQGWYPTIYLTGYHIETKYNYGFLLDEDANSLTDQDQGLFEGRNQQYANVGMLAVDYPWNAMFSTNVFSRFVDFGFRTVTEHQYAPYSWNLESGIAANFQSFGTTFSRAASLPAGRNIDLTYSYGYTDIVYQAQGGRSVDDGELLDKYGYNKVEARWTEQIPVPAWGGFLSDLNKRRHMIQLDLAAGYIDRNVDRNDEFRAGGQHPYYYGSDSLRPNTLFAGYPSSSLSGETMAQVNLAYRFPIRSQLNKKIGPLYVYDITAQVMGSAGNLWSFRAPEDEALYYRDGYGERVARNPDSVTREIPFVDSAYKNGNYLLYDAGAELRVTSTLFNSVGWNSFFRVSYGFNSVKGYGDVDGNDIQDTTENSIGDELSNEIEEPGPRFYIGLGTGW